MGGGVRDGEGGHTIGGGCRCCGCDCRRKSFSEEGPARGDPPPPPPACILWKCPLLSLAGAPLFLFLFQRDLSIKGVDDERKEKGRRAFLRLYGHGGLKALPPISYSRRTSRTLLLLASTSADAAVGEKV